MYVLTMQFIYLCATLTTPRFLVTCQLCAHLIFLIERQWVSVCTINVHRYRQMKESNDSRVKVPPLSLTYQV